MSRKQNFTGVLENIADALVRWDESHDGTSEQIKLNNECIAILRFLALSGVNELKDYDLHRWQDLITAFVSSVGDRDTTVYLKEFKKLLWEVVDDIGENRRYLVKEII